VRSFGYAFEGVVAMLRSQPNVWVHVVAACLALGLGVALGLSALELAVIVLTIALVLVAEAANTALEHVCDLVSPQYHPIVKRAKDISAAAVLLAAVAALAVAVLVYIPHVPR
jgi:diacylglycerol kinase